MGRCVSNAKVLTSLLADQLSLVAIRRGYSASTQGVLSAVTGGGMMGAKKAVEESSSNSPWAPDPVTGYYKPENHFKDVYIAELREVLLKNKISRDH